MANAEKSSVNCCPTSVARVQEDVQTQSLAALGFNKLFPLLAAPGNTNTSLPRLVPAFNYFDARAGLTQSVFNFKNLERERAASENLKARSFSYKDAREMVVLAVGNFVSSGDRCQCPG